MAITAQKTCLFQSFYSMFCKKKENKTKKNKKIAVKCDSDWLCAEISAISDKHCILSCKLMFKVVLLL